MSDTRSPSAIRKARERAEKRSKGLRPVEVWVPDTAEAVGELKEKERELCERFWDIQ
ncbi:MAG: antitoxin MazE family protein [Gammaproteobacteria bacterium]|nr:antitoxin MazE family protein [Gammaproteobacteria bacterium]MCP5013887.1 antitoxin MazE family protein [Ketobacter sp.]